MCGISKQSGKVAFDCSFVPQSYQVVVPGDDQGDRVATNWRNPLCRNWQRPLGVRKSTKVEDDQESQHDSAPDDESSSPDSFGSGNSQAFAEESFRARIGH